MCIGIIRVDLNHGSKVFLCEDISIANCTQMVAVSLYEHEAHVSRKTLYLFSLYFMEVTGGRGGDGDYLGKVWNTQFPPLCHPSKHLRGIK
jgi:hypothetical protein